MMSWKSFSQTGTDSTKIRITKPIAREVIKDLLEGDLAKERIELLESLNSELITKSDSQKNLIDNLNGQITNFKSIVISKDFQIENHIKISDTYKKAYLKEKRSKLIWKIATGVALGTAIIINK